jgi:hypothetical protein
VDGAGFCALGAGAALAGGLLAGCGAGEVGGELGVLLSAAKLGARATASDKAAAPMSLIMGVSELPPPVKTPA